MRHSIFTLAFTVALAGQEDPGTSYLFELTQSTTAQRQLLQPFDVLGAHSGEVSFLGPLQVVVPPGELTAFLAIAPDAQLLLRGRPFADIVREQSGAAFGPNPDANYFTVAEIEAEIDAAVAAFPGLARKVDLTTLPGAVQTWENRSLFALKVSDNVLVDEDEPAIVVASQIHARELNAPVMTIGAMNRVLQGYASDPALQALVDNYELWFVPMMNPDGVNHVWTVDNLWRKNRRNNGANFGVDCNRNYPFLWGACGSSSSTNSQIYRGPAPASEPETQTMRALVDWLRPEVYLDFHSSGQEVLLLYAPCATVSAAYQAFDQRYADDLRTPMGYSVRAPSASGEAPHDHWGAGGALSYLTEVGTSFQPPFAVTQAEEVSVWPGVRQALTAWRPALRGHVRSRSLQPLVATITVAPNQFAHGEVVKSRARDGRYSLWLPLGTWTVNWSAPGFLDRSQTVTVTAYDQPVETDIELDPVGPLAYLKASISEADDQFGHAVAVSGDTLVVGVPGDDSSATGVNGNANDNSVPDSGGAYVFVRSGSTWSLQAYLKASNTGPGDRFGSSAAVCGDTIVVGANQESSNATGVNGDQSDNSAALSGAAYVFVRNGSTWSQQAYLKASNTEANDDLGSSVSVSGHTIVVGAGGEDSNATGVNGNQGDNSSSDSGAAYVFVRDGTTWTQQAYLKASNTEALDAFRSVAVAGETIVVGAMGEDSSATLVNGDQTNNLAGDSGAAYVFLRSGTTWSQQAYLKASNTGITDQFGGSVSVYGETIVVGAALEDSNATGANGDESDNSALDSGAAFVFVRNGATWSQQAYLKASNTEATDAFGSVSVSGETVVVGANGEDSNATLVNGDQADNSQSGSGAAYVFVRDGTAWTQAAYLKASNSEANDDFGVSISIAGDTVVVGAALEDSNATGMNGNAGDNSAQGAGAAYVFDLLRAITLSACSQCPGTATLRVTGNPILGNAVVIDVLGATGLAFAGYGFEPLVTIPAPCGCNVLSDGAANLGFFEFTSSRSLSIPNDPFFLGVEFFCQGIDAFPTSGGCTFTGIPFSLTDIWQVTIG